MNAQEKNRQSLECASLLGTILKHAQAKETVSIQKAQTDGGQWWASIDGEHWLPVDREPTADDEAGVTALLTPKEVVHNGQRVKTITATFALQWICLHGGKPTAA